MLRRLRLRHTMARPRALAAPSSGSSFGSTLPSSRRCARAPFSLAARSSSAWASVAASSASSALRQAALTHLETWSAQNVPIAVPKKLCLAVAALAVSTSWEGALPHVQNSLQGSDADVDKACRTRAVAVELLAALPEQCFSKQFNVPLSRREHFNRYLRDASAGVLDVLTSLVGWASSTARASSPSGADRLTVAAFECLSAWISFCDIPPEKLASSPLFAVEGAQERGLSLIHI